MDFRYRVVDVFTQTPLEGNALAVFPDATGLDGETMQKIARELNLAETAFVLPSTKEGCAYRVRIFTPTIEMKFAGHPTVGTSWVLLDEGLVPRDATEFVLDELVGPVPVRVADGMIWLTTPAIESLGAFDGAVCAEALGVTAADLQGAVPRLLSAGNPCLFVALKDKAAVDRTSAEIASLRKIFGPGEHRACLFVFAATAEGAYSRMFAPEYGIVEDPATGSATGPLAAYMMNHGLMADADGTRAVSEQGTKMGRRSLLHIFVSGNGAGRKIEVGGHVVALAAGVMSLQVASR